MGTISSLDPATRLFGYGMLILAMELENLYRGTPLMCGLLLALLMDNTSYPDLVTKLYKYGVLRLVPQ